MMENAIKYVLYDENKVWLGDVVLAEGGFFGAVTDWGNFSFSWTGYSDIDELEEFLLSINTSYFADKMVQGFAYVATSLKIKKAAKTFSEKILPALQNAIKEAE